MRKKLGSLVAMALMLAMLLALSGVAQAAPVGGSADAKCLALAMRTLSPGFIPADYNFISGTEGIDDFTGQGTAGPDVICGFGGDDRIVSPAILDEGDIFLGGAGNDYVSNNAGTFYGGAGNDGVDMNSGTFYGEEGSDGVIVNEGTFYGGADTDVVDSNTGTFNGTFYGEEGYDVVYENSGTFYGGAGNDRLEYNSIGGTFYGEEGYDVVSFNEGTAYVEASGT